MIFSCIYSYNQTNRETTNFLISFHKTHKKTIELRTKMKFRIGIDGTHKKIFNFLCAMAQPNGHNKYFCVFVQAIEKLWLHEKQATKALAARRKGSVHRVSGTLALHAVTLYLLTHHLLDLLFPLSWHPYVSLSTYEPGKAAFAPSHHPCQYLDVIILI